MTTERECILIVEDHLPMQEALRLVLEDEGYEVLTADEGNSALLLMQEIRPDLIVSDLRMPVMDGFALCRAVRSRRESASTPFILVTGEPGKRTATEARQIGVNAMLPKPFDVFVLLTTIRDQLSQTDRVGFRFGALAVSSFMRQRADGKSSARQSPPELGKLGIQ